MYLCGVIIKKGTKESTNDSAADCTLCNGLYPLSVLDARFATAIEEYNAIVDAPTAISAPHQSASSPHTITLYNLQGQRLSTPQRGVNIVGGGKKYLHQ